MKVYVTISEDLLQRLFWFVSDCGLYSIYHDFHVFGMLGDVHRNAVLLLSNSCIANGKPCVIRRISALMGLLCMRHIAFA